MRNLDEALARLNGPTTHQSDVDIVTAEVERERREWAGMSLAWNQELDAANAAIRALLGYLAWCPCAGGPRHDVHHDPECELTKHMSALKKARGEGS